MKTRKQIRPRAKDIIKAADALWRELIYARAGYKSEYSGKSGRQLSGKVNDSLLNAHHILGKKTMEMRYSLQNGICLTQAEHKYIAHAPDKVLIFTEWIAKIRDLDNLRVQQIRTSKDPLYYYHQLRIVYDYEISQGTVIRAIDKMKW